jgi:hypothetical protein
MCQVLPFEVVGPPELAGRSTVEELRSALMESAP